MKALIFAALAAATALSPAQNLLTNGDLEADPFNLGWTVLTNHYPPLFLGGFLFFIGFTQITAMSSSCAVARACSVAVIRARSWVPGTPRVTSRW